MTPKVGCFHTKAPTLFVHSCFFRIEAKMDQTTITRSSTTEDVYRYLKTWRRGLKPEELNEFASIDGGDLLDTSQMMLESILGRIRGGLLWQDIHSPTPGTVFPKKLCKSLVLFGFHLF